MGLPRLVWIRVKAALACLWALVGRAFCCFKRRRKLSNVGLPISVDVQSVPVAQQEMSAEPQAPPPLLEGRLVFDHSSEADSAVADLLHDELFPSEPVDERRPLYAHRPGAESPASDGSAGSDGEQEGGGGRGAAVSAEPWVEETTDMAPLGDELQQEHDEEPLCAAALRVLDRRRVIRERFARRQAAVRELQRRCGQRPARGAPAWSPPVLVYRPPPLPAVQRRLLEPGELADTVPEPASHTRRQIAEFCRRHLGPEGADDTPR
ncbi:hypothetical protein FJT64_024813 [Amphibalanus amphitrite]|uniref:Uncharacterized protein n=1 Tax=Amphibalanus amphitrite TaxID=1232801 RepID=A0A6A4WHC0_AMPAM|nr:hypothetical protein FJT64_024813 [Amphibalanus amphitrite]